MQKEVKVIKWPHKHNPTNEMVQAEMAKFGYIAYEHQTIPGWFERSSHSHNEPEIRGATRGTTTFHFENMVPVTIEAGDILFIPPGVMHTVISHHGNEFSAFKGSVSGERNVAEHGDGKGSVEDLEQKKAAPFLTKKGVLFFDLDGTLEDSREDMVASVQRVRENLNLPSRPYRDFADFVNKGMRELYLNCFSEYYINLEPKNREVKIDRVQELYEADYMKNICVATKLYDGIQETLLTLHKNYVLVCVTNKPEKHSHALLKALKVSSFFALVVGGDTCAEAKPSPLPLAFAMEKLQLNGRENFRQVMIGDSLGDLLCGLAFGADVAWCSWGYLTEPPKTQNGKWPHAVLSQPQSLLRYLG